MTTQKEKKKHDKIKPTNLNVNFTWHDIEGENLKFRFSYRVKDSILEKFKVDKQKDVPLTEKKKAVTKWINDQYFDINEINHREFIISFNHNKFFKDAFKSNSVTYKNFGTKIIIKLKEHLPDILKAKLSSRTLRKVIAEKLCDFIEEFKRYNIFKKIKRFLPFINVKIRTRHFEREYSYSLNKITLSLKLKYIALYIFGVSIIKKVSDSVMKRKISKQKKDLAKAKKILGKK